MRHNSRKGENDRNFEVIKGASKSLDGSEAQCNDDKPESMEVDV